MGQSTNAYLYYGIALNEEAGDIEWPESWKDDDWEDEYLRRTGMPERPAFMAWTEEGDYGPYHVQDEDRTPEQEAECSAWYEERWQRLNDCPVEIDTHCSGDYPMYFITPCESVTRAFRGYPKTFHILPTRQAEWGAQLREFIDLMDLQIEEGEATPMWTLASYMG